jgi:hypothetical protein
VPQALSVDSARKVTPAGRLTSSRVENFYRHLSSILHRVFDVIAIKPISRMEGSAMNNNRAGPRCTTSYKQNNLVSPCW